MKAPGLRTGHSAVLADSTQPGIPGAGGRGTGLAARRLSNRGDVELLCCDTGTGAGMRVSPGTADTTRLYIWSPPGHYQAAVDERGVVGEDIGL